MAILTKLRPKRQNGKVRGLYEKEVVDSVCRFPKNEAHVKVRRKSRSRAQETQNRGILGWT